FGIFPQSLCLLPCIFLDAGNILFPSESHIRQAFAKDFPYAIATTLWGWGGGPHFHVRLRLFLPYPTTILVSLQVTYLMLRHVGMLTCKKEYLGAPLVPAGGGELSVVL